MSTMALNDPAPLSEGPPRAPDTPTDYIPGLYILGATYDVLNGKYADSKSALQQVIDWDKSDTRVQQYGDKTYSIPDIVNYTSDTNSDYRSSYGKTMTEYSESLSVHAGFEASFPGFSASASADYSESQRENLSNAFTRITYVVTQYNLSLPPVSQVQQYLKSWFVDDLEKRDPIEFYREYGTHMLRSLTIGGRAMFLTSTNTQSYSSSLSIEAAARISASYLVASGSIDLSVAQKQAMESFNESSQTAVVTRGGDARYGNEEFLKNVEAWANSVKEYPEFIDFGSLPCFVALSELASTESRRQTLREGYAQYVQLYAKDLELPGPYLRARVSNDLDENLEAYLTVGESGGYVTIKFPTNRTSDWYVISPGLGGIPPVIASELVPGALAPVKWEQAFIGWNSGRRTRTTFWRALPPTSDYIAMGCVASMNPAESSVPSQPPASVASRFRAVHKRALTTPAKSLTPVYRNYGEKQGVVYAVEGRYVSAETVLPNERDCYILDPKNVVEEFSRTA
ncbi:MAC/Perforin domain-containing protein [Irpex rosettiformis]|uniref:MAC/Perforin domain-containing protein n=1 Tax=Irpex rosettiformis TaxID=378272 RepID=A0ACB8TYS2_9APHY|nr:MAC/Perforin domain-containing protein [Irpex rosettiformis]